MYTVYPNRKRQGMVILLAQKIFHEDLISHHIQEFLYSPAEEHRSNLTQKMMQWDIFTRLEFSYLALKKRPIEAYLSFFEMIVRKHEFLCPKLIEQLLRSMRMYNLYPSCCDILRKIRDLHIARRTQQKPCICVERYSGTTETCIPI